MLTEALIGYAAVATILAREAYDKDHAVEVWFFSLIWPLLAVMGLVQLAICLPFQVFALIRPRFKAKPTPTIGVTRF